MKINGSKILASILLLLTLISVLSCSKKNLDTDLHLMLAENPRSLDPILSSDAIAAQAMGSIYETLLQYNYIKRPYTLEPLLADGMPTYSKNGLEVRVKIKRGIRFQDDPCFQGGKGRELVANDFVFAFQRLMDPKNQSEGRWVFNGKVVDYKALDEHTLLIKLNKKYPQLNHVMAMVYTAPVPHEAIEKYGPEIVNHPVGTGAFVVKEYIRNSQIVYERNPNFHEEYFPDERHLKLPLVNHIIAHIIQEDQPAWLLFLSGKLDLIRLPKDSFSKAIDSENSLNSLKKVEGDSHGRDDARSLRKELSEKGIQLSKSPSTTEWFIGFNMEDPIVGKNKFLRKAIGLAYDSLQDIRLFTNGVGAPMNQILPPGVNGFNSSHLPREYDIEKAKALLAKAGYPEGQGLSRLVFDTEGSTRTRQWAEFFKNQMAQIGIKVQIRVNTRPELLDRKRKGKLQVHMDGWIADYPDAENFMQLLYGPNKPPAPNNSSFNNPEFNKLYEQMAGMAPSPVRQKIIDRMTDIFLEETPWIPNWIATLYYLNQGWVQNYIYSDFAYNTYKYYGLDLEKKKVLLKNF